MSGHSEEGIRLEGMLDVAFADLKKKIQSFNPEMQSKGELIVLKKEIEDRLDLCGWPWIPGASHLLDEIIGRLEDGG